MRKSGWLFLTLTCLLFVACGKTERAELGGVRFTYSPLPGAWMDSGMGKDHFKSYTFTSGSDHSYIRWGPYSVPLGNDSESLRQAPIFKNQSLLVPTTVEGMPGLRASFKQGQATVNEVLWNKDGRTMEARLIAAAKDQAQTEKDFRALLSSMQTSPSLKVVTNQDVQKLQLKWDSGAYPRSSDPPYRNKKLVVVDRENQRLSGLNHDSPTLATQPSEIGTAAFVSFSSGQNVGQWKWSSGGTSSVVRFNIDLWVVDLGKSRLVDHKSLEAGGTPDLEGPEGLANVHKVVFSYLEGLPEQ